jgi:hypothetical protein
MDKKKVTMLISRKILGNYINGNHSVVIFDDGTKVKSTGHWEHNPKNGAQVWTEDDQDHFTYDFPENFDIKITDYCDGGCIYCHENSTVHGKHGDLRAIEPVFRSLHAGTEAACGGGDLFSHPDAMWMLRILKEQGVIANVTVNQRHIKRYRDTILQCIKEELVHGIGVSLTDSSNMEDLEIIKEMGNNVVIHVIAGIFSEKDLQFVKGRKILVLGYKDLRRGHALLEKQSDEIKKNIQWLITYLPQLRKECRCISFDCLGLEQVDPKTVLNISDKEFNTLFQGSDTDVTDADGNITCCTMYIDVPNMKVARMSTAALNKRYDFTGRENIAELLKITTQGW